MLKATIVGRVVNEPVMKKDAVTGKPYLIVEVCSRRSYKDKDGNQCQDVVPVKLYDKQAKRYLRMGFRGCKIAVSGSLEITAADKGACGILVCGRDAEYLSFRPQEPAKTELPAEASEQPAAETEAV